MGNYELINGIAAINSVIKAYNEIKEDVFDRRISFVCGSRGR